MFNKDIRCEGAKQGNYSTNEAYFADVIRQALIKCSAKDRKIKVVNEFKPVDAHVVKGFLLITDEDGKPFELPFKIDMYDVLIY